MCEYINMYAYLYITVIPSLAENFIVCFPVGGQRVRDDLVRLVQLPMGVLDT